MLPSFRYFSLFPQINLKALIPYGFSVDLNTNGISLSTVSQRVFILEFYAIYFPFLISFQMEARFKPFQTGSL